eukprot:4252734-Pleurochrysis_carterae.AAC.1
MPNVSYTDRTQALILEALDYDLPEYASHHTLARFKRLASTSSPTQRVHVRAPVSGSGRGPLEAVEAPRRHLGRPVQKGGHPFCLNGRAAFCNASARLRACERSTFPYRASLCAAAFVGHTAAEVADSAQYGSLAKYVPRLGNSTGST